MFVSFAAGNVTGYMARPALAQDNPPRNFAIFWETWDLVEEFFVDQDKIDHEAMTYGAIQGMLDTLGDENHTVFFPPEVAKQQESSLEGSFEGIGAYVSPRGGHVQDRVADPRFAGRRGGDVWRATSCLL